MSIVNDRALLMALTHAWQSLLLCQNVFDYVVSFFYGDNENLSLFSLLCCTLTIITYCSHFATGRFFKSLV